MTHLIDKSALVAEIERRIKEGEAVVENVPSSAILGLIQAYKNVLSFLDTLEVKEVGVDLGDPKGDIGVKAVWDSSNSLEISRHGNPHIGETLEEAAIKYAQDKYLPVQTAQSFKAGAQWQKEYILDDDNKQYHRLRHETLKRLYENEAKLELMLDKALEGYIEKYEQIGGHNYLSLKIPMLSKPDDCKDGDKIKLIILKEE